MGNSSIVHYFIISNPNTKYLVEPWQAILTREKIQNRSGGYNWIFEFAYDSFKIRKNIKMIELIKTGMMLKST